ncbi:unnamed protein product [Agarophyton chilense]|eukprot:gb/GEZJ01002518.1/.p1 GENE.gb/GEZJ01002518.1/~~gb/GEZJ01002518.1/.p1  ORF type:complete len:667 (-),score=73.61 gb/GEZJ01002518.1/:450-2450(-)
MDLDSILTRYFADNNVAEWLFAQNDLRKVNAHALDNAFVYTIGIKPLNNVRTVMDIEDMLIVCGVAGSFVLGIVYGLAKPHIFSDTPFMEGQRPVTRRFAVDLSVRDALEFMETNYFADGKMAVVFRRFLHTNDASLPVVVAATLHEPCDAPYTLGPVIMRTDVFEAPTCPNCGQCGKRCTCSFGSYAPNGAITHTCFSWNHFTSMFLSKAQHGLVRIRITVRIANVGDVCISHTQVPVRTVVDKGHGKYVTLLKRKAVQGMGLDVVPIRLETPLVSKSISNDFLDLHNHYVVRKRQRPSGLVDQLVPQVPFEQNDAILQDEMQILDMSQMQNPISQMSPNELLKLLNNTDVSFEHNQTVPFDPVPAIHSSKETELKPSAIDETLTTSVAYNLGQMLPQLPQYMPVASRDPPQYTPVDAVDGQTDIVKDIEDILKARDRSPATHIDAKHSHQVMSLEQRSHNHQKSVTTGSSDEAHRAAVTTSSGRSSKKARTFSSSASTKSSASGDSDSSERKHVCSTCSARFKLKGDLLRHIRTVHEGKKRHQCPTCPKAFGHSGHLNRHIQSVHLQQRRFKCEICGFQFFQASHLQSHMGHVHDPSKPFECSDCGVRVNTKLALRSHKGKTKCGSIARDENARLRQDFSAPVPRVEHMTGGRNNNSRSLSMSA